MRGDSLNYTLTIHIDDNDDVVRFEIEAEPAIDRYTLIEYLYEVIDSLENDEPVRRLYVIDGGKQ